MNTDSKQTTRDWQTYTNRLERHTKEINSEQDSVKRYYHEYYYRRKLIALFIGDSNSQKVECLRPCGAGWFSSGEVFKRFNSIEQADKYMQSKKSDLFQYPRNFYLHDLPFKTETF